MSCGDSGIWVFSPILVVAVWIVFRLAFLIYGLMSCCENFSGAYMARVFLLLDFCKNASGSEAGISPMWVLAWMLVFLFYNRGMVAEKENVCGCPTQIGELLGPGSCPLAFCPGRAGCRVSSCLAFELPGPQMSIQHPGPKLSLYALNRYAVPPICVGCHAAPQSLAPSSFAKLEPIFLDDNIETVV